MGGVWCGVVWCGVVWCGVVLCCVVWCGVPVVLNGYSVRKEGRRKFRLAEVMSVGWR